MHRALAGLVLAAVVACAPPPAVGFTDEDRAAIKAAGESMAEMANAGNPAGWEKHQASDIVMYPPNMEPVVGRDAVVEVLKSFPPMSGVTLRQEEVEGSSTFAYVRGSYAMTLSPPGAAPIQDRGNYIEIWRKMNDGRWLITRDLYNSSVPLPTP